MSSLAISRVATRDPAPTIAGEVARLARQELAPLASAIDAGSVYPGEFLRRLGEIGAWSSHVPLEGPADLRGARLKDARLNGADLREAQLGPLMLTADRLLPYVLSFVRIMTALLLLQHGLSKFFGFPMPGNHPPALFSLYWFAGAIELLFGTLLLVGLNQCILLSLAMVVLAGLVGAGGLGAEVTRGLTRMEMGLGLRAGLAIVAVALLLDRLSRGALERKRV